MIDHSRITHSDLVALAAHAFQIRSCVDRLRQTVDEIRHGTGEVTRRNAADIDANLHEAYALLIALRQRFPEVSHGDFDPPPTAHQQDRRRTNKLTA